MYHFGNIGRAYYFEKIFYFFLSIFAGVKTMPRIYTLNDVGNNDGSKLGSPPSNRYPLSRLELEEQLKKDREKFIRSAKQLITKYHVLDEKNKCMQNDLDHLHDENKRMQNSMNQIIPLANQLNGLNNKLVS